VTFPATEPFFFGCCEARLHVHVPVYRLAGSIPQLTAIHRQVLQFKSGREAPQQRYVPCCTVAVSSQPQEVLESVFSTVSPFIDLFAACVLLYSLVPPPNDDLFLQAGGKKLSLSRKSSKRKLEGTSSSSESCSRGKSPPSWRKGRPEIPAAQCSCSCGLTDPLSFTGRTPKAAQPLSLSWVAKAAAQLLIK
jgi:hypothetical protein